MIILERTMTAKKTEVKQDGASCQASYNSDGVLTLRHRSYDSDQDEIMIFSKEETRSIIRLFEQIKSTFGNIDIPF